MRETIVNELVEAVKNIAGEKYHVTTAVVKKNNGVELQAMNIKVPGGVVTSAIYVDDFVDEIEVKITEAAHKIFGIYEEHKNPVLGIDIKKIADKEYILNHVEYQLVNAEKNAEKLHEIPGKKVIDLVAIFRVVVSDDDTGLASYILDNQKLKMANITFEELDEAAMRNTQKSGFKIMTMEETIVEMMGDCIEKEMLGNTADGPHVLVLTNNRRTNGANILLYEEQLEMVAEKLHGDFYILPSSIHELLAIPVSEADVEQLKVMVKEINDNEMALKSEEILGYEVYRYNRETKEVEVTA